MSMFYISFKQCARSEHARWASPDFSHARHHDGHDQPVHQGRLQPPRGLLVLDDGHAADEHEQRRAHQLGHARLQHPLELVGRPPRGLLVPGGHERTPDFPHFHLLVAHGSSARSVLCALRMWHWARCPQVRTQICLRLLITRTLVRKDRARWSCH